MKRGKNVFVLKRAAGGWQFASGAQADSTAVANMLPAYREVTASAIATKSQEDSLKFARGYGRLKLLSRGGSPLVSLLIDSASSGVWARADSGGAVYKLEQWMLNQIAPPETTLRVKKQ